MYVPPAFAVDRDSALAMAEARGFGLLVAFDGTRPVGAHLPFILARVGDTVRLGFHVARTNRIAELANGEREMLMAVAGTDAYISPDWYTSKDQVSTWLYEAVHLSGPVRRLGLEGHLGHVDALSAKFEKRLLPKKPWTSDKMTPQRREAMLRGIVAMEMEVRLVEGARKLNQHKSEADRNAVIVALSGRPESGSQQISRLMRGLKDQGTQS
ncbi:MAG: FMN-binding negative transcriptional regulator [Hyphomicrobiaceae bacterium]|nr:MAG: FMN-binding negative transcriptional regulator [Hyphomicrobiaceae bacterium]